MRHFRAAVLFPWDPTLMAFYELYRLNTVLLLPRSGWIFKVQHFTGWIWSQPLGALEFAHVAQQRHTTGAVGEPVGIDKLGSEVRKPPQEQSWQRTTYNFSLFQMIQLGRRTILVMETHLVMVNHQNLNFLPAIGQAMLHPTPGGGLKTRTPTPSSTGAWDVANMDRFSSFPREWVKIYMGTIFGDEHLEFTSYFGANHRIPGSQALTCTIPYR